MLLVNQPSKNHSRSIEHTSVNINSLEVNVNLCSGMFYLIPCSVKVEGWCYVYFHFHQQSHEKNMLAVVWFFFKSTYSHAAAAKNSDCFLLFDLIKLQHSIRLLGEITQPFFFFLMKPYICELFLNIYIYKLS